MRQPRNHPRRHYIRLPAYAPAPAAVDIDPVRHDMPGMRTARFRPVCSDMPKPSKTVQALGKGPRRQFQLERRIPECFEHPPGQRETPIENFMRNEGIDRTQVGRGNDQAFGNRRQRSRQGDAIRRDAEAQTPPHFLHTGSQKPSAIGEPHGHSGFSAGMVVARSAESILDG
ncbi:hypothetical protein D3C73_823750 [compost metagenome]